MSEKKKIVNSSEDIRSAIRKTGLTLGQREVYAAIAIRVDWSKPVTETPVKLSNPELAYEAGLSIRSVQSATKFLRDSGYIEIRTISKYCKHERRYKNVGNEFRVTPLLFLNAERAEIVESISHLENEGLPTVDLKNKLSEMDGEIDGLCESALSQPERPEALRGRRASKIKKLHLVRMKEKDSERACKIAAEIESIDKKIEVFSEMSAEEKRSKCLVSYIYPKPLHTLVNPASHPRATSFIGPCRPAHSPVKQVSHILNSSQSEYQSYDNSHSMKKNQKGLSEVSIRMAEMNLFSRYSQALKQPAETEKNQKSFGLKVLKCCGSKLAGIEPVFQDLEEALKLVETSKALQDPPESGGYHSLGRLLFLEDLKKLDASSRLKYCQEARNFGGTVGMAHGAERMARAYKWDEAETSKWLSNSNAGNVSKGEQGDKVSETEKSRAKGFVSTGVAEDSQTREPSESLRGSGNEQDASGDTEAPDRNESDFQRRFRERKERAEQGGFLAGESIGNRPLAESCSESEHKSVVEKSTKPKPTKALKQFNAQLQAGKLSPATPESQPEDVKKPAPESSEAGRRLRNSSRKGQYLESDTAFNDAFGPENVASQQQVEVGMSQSQEATPAGKTSQYDFNVLAAGLSAASQDPKNIAADSDFLSLHSSGNDAKNPESELNLGGTGSYGGRNEPAAETSATSNLLQEQSLFGMVFSEPDLAAESPESPAGSDLGGFEQGESQAKQKPETPKDSGCKDSFTEDLYQLNSTSTGAGTKKSKPESAMEPGQELVIDVFMRTEDSTAESRESDIGQTRQNLTTASPGFDETAQAVRQPTVASDSEVVDENFNGSVTAREKTSAVRDCDGGGENTAEQCGRPGETGEKEMAGCADPSEPRNGETVTDYVFRACRVASGGDNVLWLSLWMEADSLETDTEKIDWAEQKLRKKYSKEHDITQVA